MTSHAEVQCVQLGCVYEKDKKKRRGIQTKDKEVEAEPKQSKIKKEGSNTGS